MNNLDLQLINKASIEIVKQHEVAKNILRLFSQNYNKGHTLFQINTYSKEVEV